MNDFLIHKISAKLTGNTPIQDNALHFGQFCFPVIGQAIKSPTWYIDALLVWAKPYVEGIIETDRVPEQFKDDIVPYDNPMVRKFYQIH